MSKLRLKQLAQNVASDKQVIRYNSSTGLWEPAYDVIVAPTNDDKAQIASATTGNNQDSGVNISNTPYGDSYPTVMINGIAYTLGDGVTTKDCYFSTGSGYTPLTTCIDLNNDTVDEYIDFGHFSQVSFTKNSPFSGGLWVKFTGTAAHYFITKYLWPGQRYGYLFTASSGASAGKFSINITDNTFATFSLVSSAQNINDGSWHFICWTYDGSNSPNGLKVYNNGTDVSDGVSGSSLSGTITNTASLLIGARGGTTFNEYVGKMIHSFMADKELSAAEILELYNGGAPKDLSQSTVWANIVHWSALGDGDAIGAGNINDLSSLNNNGTFINGESGDFVADVPSGGVMVRNIVDIEGGDTLNWNGTIVGFDLTTNDVIDLDYNVPLAGATNIVNTTGLTLIEKKTITVATNSVIFSGLDGESDEVYYLVYRIKNDDGSTSNYSLEPNQSANNCLSSIYYFTKSTDNNTADIAELRLGTIGTGNYGQGSVSFYAKKTSKSTSMRRLMTGQMSTSTSGALTGYESSGIWNDTSNSLTSLEFVASQASGIGQGSELVLYKTAQS